MRNNSLPCTAGEPSTLARIHPDAVVIREADDIADMTTDAIAFGWGGKARYRCPNCALEFERTEDLWGRP